MDGEDDDEYDEVMWEENGAAGSSHGRDGQGGGLPEGSGGG